LFTATGGSLVVGAVFWRDCGCVGTGILLLSPTGRSSFFSGAVILLGFMPLYHEHLGSWPLMLDGDSVMSCFKFDAAGVGVWVDSCAF